ncbi:MULTISPECIES: HU family DNA-binding protein [Porphyromonas]|uniref:HU family DNA-binding protein n=1 Tax=Porphyromonas TaxID=836 RepID=UPI00068B4F4A|nr:MULTISPECIES: HU family DNA-binding protein [Porphyromonas]
MAIYFKVQESKNGINKKSEKLVFARAKSIGDVGVEDMAKLISERSCVSTADVKATLDNLAWASSFFLKQGLRVSLGDLGRLSLVIRSKSTTDKESFNISKIEGAKPRFHAGKWLRAAIKEASLTNIEEYAKKKNKPEAGGSADNTSGSGAGDSTGEQNGGGEGSF